MVLKIYNHSIDFAKGGLIFLVIISHILEGSLKDNFLRFFIYSFHMPMFLFISGYLININRLQTYKFIDIFKYYVKRMIGWWFIAWCIYTCITIDHFTMRNILKKLPKSLLSFMVRTFITRYDSNNLYDNKIYTRTKNIFNYTNSTRFDMFSNRIFHPFPETN